jgi:hypothetical protein
MLIAATDTVETSVIEALRAAPGIISVVALES